MLPPIDKLILFVYVIVLWLVILTKIMTDAPVAGTIKVIKEKLIPQNRRKE